MRRGRHSFSRVSLGSIAYSFSSESLDLHLYDNQRGGRIAVLLSSHQRSAIASFLELVTSRPNFGWFHEDAKAGLRTTWKKTGQNGWRDPGDGVLSDNQRPVEPIH